MLGHLDKYADAEHHAREFFAGTLSTMTWGLAVNSWYRSWPPKTGAFFCQRRDLPLQRPLHLATTVTQER